MKVKDLLKFNLEADLTLLGDDYIPKELEIYGWDASDHTEDVDDKISTNQINLVIKGKEYNNEK